MKRVISFLQTIRLRQVVTVFLVAVTFLVSSAFSSDLQAQARSITPEADSYQVDRSNNDNRAQYLQEDQIENSQNKLKSTADNIREKLNLDEELPRSTKEFLNQVEDKVDDILPGE